MPAISQAVLREEMIDNLGALHEIIGAAGAEQVQGGGGHAGTAPRAFQHGQARGPHPRPGAGALHAAGRCAASG
ncbi:MAG: hypothetical protein MZW92_11120 [Comamonadaceae bacterium]|nr:hypothetical protein [Comamonadaceae bacterium]